MHPLDNTDYTHVTFIEEQVKAVDQTCLRNEIDGGVSIEMLIKWMEKHVKES